jgi:CheY-like chemotaxis protein
MFLVCSIQTPIAGRVKAGLRRAKFSHANNAPADARPLRRYRQAMSIVDAKPVVLVVEDEVFIRFDLADFLRDNGLEVIEAGTAQEAVEALATATRIDLVFSDIQMPGAMNGLGLASFIRASHPGLPVILTSGASLKMDIDPALADIMPIEAKPYDTDLVLARILRTLAQAQG